MKWTVVYRPAAADELAAIWLKATDRNAITVAANAIDLRLQEDPMTAGESRGEHSRILIELPLAVFFDVLEQDRIVSIWGVVSQK